MEGWRWEVCEGGEEACETVRTVAGLVEATSEGRRWVGDGSEEGGRREGRRERWVALHEAAFR